MEMSDELHVLLENDPSPLPQYSLERGGGQVGPRANLDTVEKNNFLPLPETEPRYFVGFTVHKLVTVGND
jgi:hypothetical protein